MAKRKKKKSRLIDTDASIGAALRFDPVNAQDFMDRKLRDIEGLLTGVMAISTLQEARLDKTRLPDIRPVSSVGPRVLLESALLSLGELHTVASELVHRYTINGKK